MRISTKKYFDNDWYAVDLDIYDGAIDAGPQLIGQGETEQEAIDDLKQLLEDNEIYN